MTSLEDALSFATDPATTYFVQPPPPIEHQPPRPPPCRPTDAITIPSPPLRPLPHISHLRRPYDTVLPLSTRVVVAIEPATLLLSHSGAQVLTVLELASKCDDVMVFVPPSALALADMAKSTKSSDSLKKLFPESSSRATLRLLRLPFPHGAGPYTPDWDLVHAESDADLVSRGYEVSDVDHALYASALEAVMKSRSGLTLVADIRTPSLRALLRDVLPSHSVWSAGMGPKGNARSFSSQALTAAIEAARSSSPLPVILTSTSASHSPSPLAPLESPPPLLPRHFHISSLQPYSFDILIMDACLFMNKEEFIPADQLQMVCTRHPVLPVLLPAMLAEIQYGDAVARVADLRSRGFVRGRKRGIGQMEAMASKGRRRRRLERVVLRWVEERRSGGGLGEGGAAGARSKPTMLVFKSGRATTVEMTRRSTVSSSSDLYPRAIHWVRPSDSMPELPIAGFCYVNNIVLGILELLRIQPRVLYIDVDVHGDGVEEAFYVTNQVMTSSLHRSESSFPGTGDVYGGRRTSELLILAAMDGTEADMWVQDMGMYQEGQGVHGEVPLCDGITDNSSQSIFMPVIDQIMELFRPGAVVLQMGADSLSGDTRVHHNVARAWIKETAVMCGVELPEDLPYNQFLEYCGPRYKLEILPTNNPPEYLEGIKTSEPEDEIDQRVKKLMKRHRDNDHSSSSSSDDALASSGCSFRLALARLQRTAAPTPVPGGAVPGFWSELAAVRRETGARGRWKGVGTGITMGIPSSATYMLGYKQLSLIISPYFARSLTASLTPGPLIAGSLARTLSATVISPIEMFRTRLQALSSPEGISPTYRSVTTDMYKLVQNKGVAILYRGLGPTLWRDVPFSGIYWAGFETLKTLLSSPSSPLPLLAPIPTFLAGFLSGTFSALLTQPFDVLETRRQVFNPFPGCTTTRASTLPLVWHVVKTEGWGALYAGTSARCGKVAPACGLMIACYEGVGRFLGGQEA
ncbi:hypothetical protein IAT38_007308 [Cryptococcus sp. DSM 104549]